MPVVNVAMPAVGKPVALVSVPDDGVPRAPPETRFPLATPVRDAVIVPAAKFPDPSRATTVLTVLAVAMPVPVGSPLITGVASVGVVPKTREPEPVSSVTAVARLALDGVPRNVRMPAPVVVVEGATPAPPPTTSAFAANTPDEAQVEADAK